MIQMAISYCSTALLPRHLPRCNPYSFNSVTQPNLDRGFGIRLWNCRRFESTKPERVSCLPHSRVVTAKSWDKVILESTCPALVEFYASWCGPCRMVHRVIDEIAAEYSGKLNCFMVDVDKDMKVAENYDVKSVPVVLLFKNGEVVETVTGTMPKEFYVAAIERVLTS